VRLPNDALSENVHHKKKHLAKNDRNGVVERLLFPLEKEVRRE